MGDMETLLWLGGPPAALHVLTTSWQQSGERRRTEPQRTGDQALSAVRRSLAIFEDVVPEDTGEGRWTEGLSCRWQGLGACCLLHRLPACLPPSLPASLPPSPTDLVVVWEPAASSTTSLPASLPPSPTDLATALWIFTAQVLRTKDTGCLAGGGCTVTALIFYLSDLKEG